MKYSGFPVYLLILLSCSLLNASIPEETARSIPSFVENSTSSYEKEPYRIFYIHNGNTNKWLNHKRLNTLTNGYAILFDIDEDKRIILYISDEELVVNEVDKIFYALETNVDCTIVYNVKENED